jgi:hypothetical protein
MHSNNEMAYSTILKPTYNQVPLQHVVPVTYNMPHSQAPLEQHQVVPVTQNMPQNQAFSQNAKVNFATTQYINQDNCNGIF